MRADRIKQALKNGVYRSLGEAATGVGAVDGDQERTLRVLMYHKVNDVAGNSVTVPVGLFDEQMAQLGELGYRPVVARRGARPLRRAGRRCPPARC